MQSSLPAQDGTMHGTYSSVRAEDPGVPQHVEGLQPQAQILEHARTPVGAAADGGHEGPHPDTVPWESTAAAHPHALQDQPDPGEDVKPLNLPEAHGDRLAGAAVAALPSGSAPPQDPPSAPATAAADGGDWAAWHGADATTQQGMYAAPDQAYAVEYDDARQQDGGQSAAGAHQMSPPPMATDGRALPEGDTTAQVDAFADAHQQRASPTDHTVPAATHSQPLPSSPAPAPGMQASALPSHAPCSAAAPAAAEGSAVPPGTMPGAPGSRPGKRSRPAGAVTGQPPPSRVTRSTAQGAQRPPPAAGHTGPRRNGHHISDGTAATILVALQSGTNPPQRGGARRQSRTTADDVPTFTTSEAAADARANIEGERDALFLALRRNVPNAASKLQLSPLSVTQHVLKVVCTLQVHDTYLTKEGANETVTQLNIPVPATRGPAVELPTFRLACGNREGMMLVTMLICYVNVGVCPSCSHGSPATMTARLTTCSRLDVAHVAI